MALKTTLEQLENVQATIQKVETYGQAHGNDGRTLTRGNLQALYAREKELLAKYNAEQENFYGRTYGKQGGRGT